MRTRWPFLYTICAGTPTTVEFGGTVAEHDRTGSYARVLSDRNVAENVGVVADEDAVAKSRMPLAVALAGAAQRDSLIERDVAAHNGRFADNNAIRVIDEEGAGQSEPRDEYRRR